MSALTGLVVGAVLFGAYNRYYAPKITQEQLKDYLYLYSAQGFYDGCNHGIVSLLRGRVTQNMCEAGAYQYAEPLKKEEVKKDGQENN